jgi:hypothetical protein
MENLGERERNRFKGERQTSRETDDRETETDRQEDRGTDRWRESEIDSERVVTVERMDRQIGVEGVRGYKNEYSLLVWV